MSNAVQNGTTLDARRPDTGRGGGLDALRFVASLLIVLYHYGSQAPVALDHFHPVFDRGFLATDFFLILSGYVLGQAYGAQILSGRIGIGRFVLKRVTRLWPGQMIVLIGLTVVVGLSLLAGITPAHPDHYTLKALWMQVFLVQSWGVEGGGGWNMPSWSLSALLVCYAVFPFAWRQVSRLTSALALMTLGLSVVMLGNLACWRLLGRPLSDLPMHFGVLRALPLFFLGVCIARAVSLGTLPSSLAQAMTWGAAIVLVVLQMFGRFDMLSIAAIAAIVLAWGRLPVAKPSATVESAAKLSFALFITHTLAGLVWFGLGKYADSHFHLSPTVDWALWLMAFPFAMTVALVFHRFIDTPLQGWLAPRMAVLTARRVQVARAV